MAVALVAALALSSAPSLAFQVPERLVFDLKWLGIKAGTATLEIRKQGEGGLLIISTARSASWVSVFYPVKDKVQSLLAPGGPAPASETPVFPGMTDAPVSQDPASVLPDPDGAAADPAAKGLYGFFPANYRLITREGSHRKDKEVIFDRQRGRATYVDHRGGETREAEVPRTVFDPLSSFYLVRTMDLQVGRPLHVPVFDSKKLWNVEVQVLRKERVTVPAGTFDTIVIKPLMKSEGIFSSKGAILIWVTDDERRMPVLLRSKVAVGSINAELSGMGY
jgi:hypothetical protein